MVNSVNISKVHSDLLIKRLKAEHPAIYLDLAGVKAGKADINAVIAEFCNITGITQEQLINRASLRFLLLSVCIHYYQPEKILNMSNQRLKNGIFPAITNFCKCNRTVLSNWVGQIVFQFNVYEGFREEVEDISNNIKLNFDI